MKARQAKRERLVAKYAAKRAQLKKDGDYAALQKLPATHLPSACTTSARCPVAPRATCVSSASPASTSARWLLTDSSPAYARLAGDFLTLFQLKQNI